MRKYMAINTASFPLAQEMIRLACLLVFLLSTYQLVAQAQATLSTSILPRDDVPSNCPDGCLKRTLFSIIWGCISTTIICAWTAIHPNIPPRESPLKKTLRRLELMFWTIIAPEILPCWALNQRLAAMTVTDVYNKGKGVLCTSFNERIFESSSGYEKERSGIWMTLKEMLSLYELPKNKSHGG